MPIWRQFKHDYCLNRIFFTDFDSCIIFFLATALQDDYYFGNITYLTASDCFLVAVLCMSDEVIQGKCP